MRRLSLLAGIAVLLPFLTEAHEVYVLSSGAVEKAMTMPPLQVFDIVYAHVGQFFFWGFIVAWAILTIWSIAISKPIERKLDPLLARLKPYAPLVARITLGIAIAASGYFGAMFGPELPFSAFLSPQSAVLMSMVLICVGMLLVLGLFTRLTATLLMIIYIGMWPHYGSYMLTYTNYFGEMLTILIVGNAAFALDTRFHHLYPSVFHATIKWFENHAFLILRVAFGFSLIFASVYAKFFHAELALQTVFEYHLADYFSFDPEFLVLGAFAIELLLGLFIMCGLEIRFATLFLGFFLTLSLLYFGEAVWPHIILFGGAVAIFMHGYDTYTLQWGLLKMRHPRAREPVL